MLAVLIWLITIELEWNNQAVKSLHRVVMSRAACKVPYEVDKTILVLCAVRLLFKHFSTLKIMTYLWDLEEKACC